MHWFQTFQQSHNRFLPFHPLASIDLLPKTKVALNQKTFIFVLAHSPHLSFGSFLGMVYELL